MEKCNNIIKKHKNKNVKYLINSKIKTTDIKLTSIYKVNKKLSSSSLNIKIIL